MNLSTGKWTELFSAENFTLVKKGIYKLLFLIGKSEIGYNGRDSYYKLYDEKGTLQKEFNDKSSFEKFKLSIKYP